MNRARRELNRDTIHEMHKAFRRGGAQAINKVMRNNPAMFLKLLVLLVPREMQIELSGGVRAMTTEQIERSIELIKEMLAQREAGANAKVVEGVAKPAVLPAPRKPRRKTRKRDTLAARERDAERVDVAAGVKRGGWRQARAICSPCRPPRGSRRGRPEPTYLLPELT